jgi:hypothetical protein
VSVAERLGDNALPAWRELTTAPCGGPHARAVLASFDLGPELDEADRGWLAAETAAAALEDKGPDEALSCVSDVMPGDGLDDQLAVVRATRASRCWGTGAGDNRVRRIWRAPLDQPGCPAESLAAWHAATDVAQSPGARHGDAG